MPAVTGPNLQLDFGFNVGESGWNDEIDGDILKLDAVVQLGVLDKDLSTPPGSPANGDRYIVGPSATGAWAGQEKSIARYRSAAWEFYAPAADWVAYVRDEGLLYVYTGTVWEAISPVVNTFKGLADTPSSYVSQGLKFIRLNSGETALEFATPAGAGDVTGPVSSTDNALARYDGTTGDIQNSGWTLDDSNVMNAAGNILQAAAILDAREQKETINPVAASETLHFASGGPYKEVTLTQNTTPDFDGAVSGKNCSMVVNFIQDGTGGRTITWTNVDNWFGTSGAAPTLSTNAGEQAVFLFWTTDGGTTINAAFIGQDV